MYTYIGDAGDRMFGKSIKAPQGGLPIVGGAGTTGEAHPTTSHSSGSGGGDEEEEEVTTKKHKTK